MKLENVHQFFKRLSNIQLHENKLNGFWAVTHRDRQVDRLNKLKGSCTPTASRQASRHETKYAVLLHL
jgi:hypothetical protein